MEKVRKHFIFHGRVQGVGFRYHARESAAMLGMTGWVRNCYDGTVEAEVQGTEADLADFIKLLNQNRYIQIDEIEARTIPLVEERGFRVTG